MGKHSEIRERLSLFGKNNQKISEKNIREKYSLIREKFRLITEQTLIGAQRGDEKNNSLQSQSYRKAKFCDTLGALEDKYSG